MLKRRGPGPAAGVRTRCAVLVRIVPVLRKRVSLRAGPGAAEHLAAAEGFAAEQAGGSAAFADGHLSVSVANQMPWIRSRPVAGWLPPSLGCLARRTHKKTAADPRIRRCPVGGGRYRVRTCDPYHVKVVLYR